LGEVALFFAEGLGVGRLNIVGREEAAHAGGVGAPIAEGIFALEDVTGLGAGGLSGRGGGDEGG
jgi:hypothetical protein